MKTNVRKTGKYFVVDIEGKLDYENQVSLKDCLDEILFDTSGTASFHSPQIIFNLEKLQFVGSSGISTFVQTLRMVQGGSAIKPRYCNVGSEFKKIMKAFAQGDDFEFFENEESAMASFQHESRIPTLDN